MKKGKAPSVKLKRVFGLVAREETGALVLSRSGTPLAPVLESIAGNYDGQALHARHPGIKPEEIKAAKAYACRFGTDADNPAQLPAGRKMLLLDENISYGLLPLACNLFGPSSHVEAEGLSRQNLKAAVSVQELDASICAFAVRHAFAGIFTRDTDFAIFYKNPAHPVTKLNVFLLKDKNGIPEETVMRENQGLIHRQIDCGKPALIHL